MTTGCSFGNNALVFRDLGKTAVTISFRKSRAGVRLALKPGTWESVGGPQKAAEAGELFRQVVKERRQDPALAQRMAELFRELSFEVIEMPIEKLFDIQEVPAELPPYAPIYDSVRCSVCGAEVMETKAAVHQGKAACLDCAGRSYFVVDGRGVGAVAGR